MKGRYTDLIEPGKRRRWVWVVLFGLLVSLLEATGAVLVFTLITLTTDPGGPVELPVFGDLRQLIPDLDQDELMIAAAIGIALFFIIRAVVVLLQRYHESRVTQLTGVDLSTRLLARYLRLPYSFHLRRNSSELLRNTTDSVAEFLGSVLIPAVLVLTEGMAVLAILVVLVVTAPVATGLAAAIIGPVVFVSLRIVQPRLAHQGRVSQREGARSYQALQQGLHGFRDITVLGRQDYFVDLYRTTRERIAEARYKRAVLTSLPRVAIEAAVIVFISGFIALTTVLGEEAQRSLPVLGLFAYAALRILPAVNHIVGSMNSIRFGRAAIEDILADLALPLPPSTGDERPLAFTSELRLEAVTFQYEGTDEPTLQNLDLVIPRGASVGIVGPTGVGKSTLLDLLVGLSSPTAGRILVDGIDLRGREAAWQRNLGLVSQQVFLMDDTLRRNVALGLPEDEIDDARVRQAITLAQLEDFVASLPAGLDSTVGERGARVSGGQRQRIAIARALYTEPSVLVFDEGTSALDNLTEAALIAAIGGLRQSHTIITVAHRLSTVQDYDRIVFMHEGRIRDIGRFEELAGRSEDFRRFARRSGAATP